MSLAFLGTLGTLRIMTFPCDFFKDLTSSTKKLIEIPKNYNFNRYISQRIIRMPQFQVMVRISRIANDYRISREFYIRDLSEPNFFQRIPYVFRNPRMSRHYMILGFFFLFGKLMLSLW